MIKRPLKVAEDNNALIGQLANEIQNLKTNFNAAHHIGSGNKGEVNLEFSGSSSTGLVEHGAEWRNANGTDANWAFDFPSLPYTIYDLDGNAKNLIITQTLIGISGAAEGDEVDRLRWEGFTDEDSRTEFLDTGAGLDLDTAQEYPWDHADTTIGGVYERAYLLIGVIVTNARTLKLSYVKIEYYYG